jgi:MFS transporter, OFA family, oxalate/formate antiporter
MNYGIVYTAWGLGGFMLSQLAGTIKDATGSFTNAYFLAAALLAVAAGLMAIIKTPQPVDQTLSVKADVSAIEAD